MRSFSVALRPQTVTIRLIRDGKPRTATSTFTFTFTQLLSSELLDDDDVVLNVFRCRPDILRTNYNKLLKLTSAYTVDI